MGYRTTIKAADSITTKYTKQELILMLLQIQSGLHNITTVWNKHEEQSDRICELDIHLFTMLDDAKLITTQTEKIMGWDEMA